MKFNYPLIIFLSIIILVFSSSSVIAQVSPGTENLTAYYSFDSGTVVSNTSVTDVHSGLWNSSKTKMANINQPGVNGESILMVSANTPDAHYVDIGRIITNQKMSINIWFKSTNNCSSTANYLYGFDDRSGVTDLKIFSWSLSNSGPSRFLGREGTVTQLDRNYNGANLCTDKWRLFTTIYDSSVSKVDFWIDGVNITSYDDVGDKSPYTITLKNFSIGGYFRPDVGDYIWSPDGYIDEVSIWTGRLLTPDEILWLNNSANAKYSALVTVATPPVVQQLNFTSDGAVTCSSPSICANTTDLTPSFKILFDESAQVRMALSNSSFTVMNNSCQAGNFSTTVSCTWPTDLPLNNSTTIWFAANGTNGVYNTELPVANTAILGIIGVEPTCGPVLNIALSKDQKLNFEPINWNSTMTVPINQSNDFGIFNFSIAGNCSTNTIKMNISQALTNRTFFANSQNTTTSGLVTLDETDKVIYGNISNTTSGYIWLWMNITGVTKQGGVLSFNINIEGDP